MSLKVREMPFVVRVLLQQLLLWRLSCAQNVVTETNCDSFGEEWAGVDVVPLTREGNTSSPAPVWISSRANVSENRFQLIPGCGLLGLGCS